MITNIKILDIRGKHIFIKPILSDDSESLTHDEEAVFYSAGFYNFYGRSKVIRCRKQIEILKNEFDVDVSLLEKLADDLEMEYDVESSYDMVSRMRKILHSPEYKKLAEQRKNEKKDEMDKEDTELLIV